MSTTPPPPPSPYRPETVVPAPTAAVAPSPLVPAAPPATDGRSVVLAGAGSILFLLAAVVNGVSMANFPDNAPVEQAFAFGITVDLVAVFITLGVRFMVIRNRPRADGQATAAPSGLAIVGAVLSLVAFIGWFPFGGSVFLHKLLAGEDLRYYLDVAGAFFLGIPWVLGIIFGVISIRRGRGMATTVVALVAVILGLVLLVPTLYSAVVYGLGLSA